MNQPSNDQKTIKRNVDVGQRYLFVALLNDVIASARKVEPDWSVEHLARKENRKPILSEIAKTLWGNLEKLYRNAQRRVRGMSGEITRQQFLDWTAQKNGREAVVNSLATLTAIWNVARSIQQTNLQRSRRILAYPQKTVRLLHELARRSAGLFPELHPTVIGDGLTIVWPDDVDETPAKGSSGEHHGQSDRPSIRVNMAKLRSVKSPPPAAKDEGVEAKVETKEKNVPQPQRQFSFLPRDWTFVWKEGVDFSACRTEKDLLVALERATITSLFKLIFTDLQSRGLRICERVDSISYPCGRVFVAKGRARYCPRHRSTIPKVHSFAEGLKDQVRDERWALTPLTRRKALLHEWFPGRADALIDFLQSPEYRPRKRRNGSRHKFGASYWAMKKLVDKASSKKRPR